jgi:crotonobetainyl-CoA:carnitine CoA-transferase CaiB-like acyl-CoA transferase
VVDLSSLWAGPLCGHLLAAAGARVIKVESRGRPDGARQAAGPFFDLLNAGKASIALDLAENAGLQRLRGLIAEADIVVESARPRALAQLGIDAAACTAARPGQIWLSITGHGRRGPAGHWVGFGDDAAIAAGAAARLGPGPIFCGDAIADPLTGLHAAVAALAHFRAGRGALLDVSLHAVTRYALAAGPAGPGTPACRARIEATGRGASAWRVVTAQGEETVAPPRARPAPGRAAPLGADNAGLLGENHGFTALEAAR